MTSEMEAAFRDEAAERARMDALDTAQTEAYAEGRKDEAEEQAKALAKARNDALEEAAVYVASFGSPVTPQFDALAYAIRALKEPQ